MLAVVGILLVGYLYTVQREEATNIVAVAVRGYLSVEQKQVLAERINAYAPAELYGPITLEVYEFPAAGSEAGAQDVSRRFNELSTQIRSGAADMVLLDSYSFELLADDSLFEDLTALYPGDTAISGNYLYMLADKPFVETEGLENLPPLAVALRNSQLGVVNKNTENLERYAFYRTLLDNIVRDRT